MQTESFSVQNVKCGGCADNIDKGIAALSGVTTVTVDIDSGDVEITGDMLDRQVLSTKLNELGYPEK